MTTDDQWLNMTKMAERICVSVATLRDWERQGLIHANGEGRGRLFRVSEGLDAKAPLGYLPVPIVVTRTHISSSTIYGWERSGAIPPFLRAGERKTYILETDIPRIRAWDKWRNDPRYVRDYPPGFSFKTAYGSLTAFEAALERGDIPDRYNPRFFHARGVYHDHKCQEGYEG